MIKKILPRSAVNALRRLKALIQIFGNFFYDARRFYVNSSSGLSDMAIPQLQGRMFAKAHSIEKGLSMPEVRSFFGEAALKELVRCMRAYDRAGGDREHAAYRKGTACLRAYLDFHAARGAALPDRFAFISAFASEAASGDGGVIACDAATMRAAARGDFRSLALSRHSIRQFADRPVAPALIAEAVALAQHAPSVCNRQGASAYLITDPSLMRMALEIQGGNRGFGQEIRALLVVVCDLAVFRDAKERYQGWIDGGMFSMMLLQGLHYLGLGACPLNWSADAGKDRKLRRLLGIPDTELVIMLIGAGHLRDEFVVARSPRRAAALAYREIGASEPNVERKPRAEQGDDMLQPAL